MAFVSAGYWDLDAAFATDPAFAATLVGLDGRRVATGKDFGPDGNPANDAVVVLDEPAAQALVTTLEAAACTVRRVEEKPFTSRPKAPFMTSTLQQEGGRKLRLGRGAGDAGRPGPLRAGLHHLHAHRLHHPVGDGARRGPRPDGRALRPGVPAAEAPDLCPQGQERAGGPRGHPPGRRPFRTPDSLSGELSGDDLRLYDLIWKRTVASQMADARGRTVSVRIAGTDGRHPTPSSPRRGARSPSPATCGPTSRARTTPTPARRP